ncbi:MAG: cell division protein ZapA [Endozoicomonadaceae bacterium]|nr:cell division protein ZapA [Endozoicomonadaceae bacterium]
MTTENPATTITIMDKTYRIHAPAEEQEALIQSAAYLNEKMKDIKKNSQLIEMEQISIIAALNLTHELLIQKKQQTETKQQHNKLQELTLLLENALVPSI